MTDRDVAQAIEAGETSVFVDASAWPAVAKRLSSELGFSFLSDLCGVDNLGSSPRFEVVYNLTDLETPSRFRVRVAVPDGDSPTIKTVTDIWPTANWMEREAFDMFGIVFEGHPDLTRILMPDEWEGFPLRKDYAVGKVPVEYKHLSPGYS
jgi:NADH-quinone oxidoreductase subunit C